MGLSFRLAAVKELSRKKKKFEVGARRCRRALLNPDSKAVAIRQIPEDVLMEILMRLPAKSLMRFKCVSKFWSFLISSRYFTNLFLKTRRRHRLFTYIVNKEKHSEFALLSSSPNPDSDRSVSVLDKDLNIPGMGGYFVSALRGLLCVRVGRRVRICNLTTKQLVELPIIISNILGEGDDNVWNYFGHDTVHDEYKVLNIVWEVSKEEREVRSEHQLLVLGPGASWRNIQSAIPPPHRPCSQGISINGVLYYGAWIDKNTSVVMSFDLSSEEFTLIKLPLDIISRPNLMNYGGKIAVFEYSKSLLAINGSVDLWTMKDAGKSIWSNKMSFVLPVSQMNFVTSYYHLGMQGTSRSGEVRLAKANLVCAQPILFVSYDLERKKMTTRAEINPLCDRIGVTSWLQTNFWDDIESIMYLET